MIDLKRIVSNPSDIEESLRKRGARDLIAYVSDLVRFDKERRTLLQEVEALKQRKNTASQQIGREKKAKIENPSLQAEMKELSQRIKDLDEKVQSVETVLQSKTEILPNILDHTVPVGSSSADNREVRRWGEIKEVQFKIKSHDEIGESLGILDFSKAGLVSGARFVFLKGKAAQLERALIQFMLSTHIARGYQEILPPYIVNRSSLFGTGQLPKFEEELFKLEKFEYFLIPTAEVPVTNYHRDEILDEKSLPKRYVAHTPCFRAEAGSYGKDTKGLKRQHQFNKVEMVKFTTPENSDKELESMVQDAENILQLLKLPYRVMMLCSQDTGFASSKSYDLEVWSPAAQSYIEISSCSNCKDFQARRANIRYRDTKLGKVQFVHTLNGSGLAVGRTLMAIIENYQTVEGAFDTPEVLLPYLR